MCEHPPGVGGSVAHAVHETICLQSTSMAFASITEENLYLCTGNPLPRDIEAISQCLLKEDYADALKSDEIRAVFGQY